MIKQTTNTGVNIHTCVSMSPLNKIQYGISGIFGDFHADLLKKYYPDYIGERVNVILSELINNVIENTNDQSSSLDFELKIHNRKLLIKVKNKVKYDTFLDVKNQLRKINESTDANAYMQQTIRRKRAKNQQGGLGLIRLTSETKASTNVRYHKDSSCMTISAILQLGENE